MQGTAYLPQEDGTFHLHEVSPYTTLIVEGPATVPVGSTASRPNSFSPPSVTMSSTPPAGSSLTPPTFRPVLTSLQARHSLHQRFVRF